MFAVKGNVEYSITENEKKQYIEAGYDIYDENGKKISEGANKKVSAKQYSELKKKYEELDKKLSEKDAEIKKLNKELEEKDAELKKCSEKEKTEDKNIDENKKK